jgi:hypothetical protein
MARDGQFPPARQSRTLRVVMDRLKQIEDKLNQNRS